MNIRPVVSIEEARRRCGCSRRTIYNWIAAKKIDVVRSAGGKPHIFVDSLWAKGTVAKTVRIVVEQSPAIGQE